MPFLQRPASGIPLNSGGQHLGEPIKGRASSVSQTLPDSDSVSSRSLYLHDVVLRNHSAEGIAGELITERIENRLDDYQR